MQACRSSSSAFLLCSINWSTQENTSLPSTPILRSPPTTCPQPHGFLSLTRKGADLTQRSEMRARLTAIMKIKGRYGNQWGLSSQRANVPHRSPVTITCCSSRDSLDENHFLFQRRRVFPSSYSLKASPLPGWVSAFSVLFSAGPGSAVCTESPPPVYSLSTFSQAMTRSLLPAPQVQHRKLHDWILCSH